VYHFQSLRSLRWRTDRHGVLFAQHHRRCAIKATASANWEYINQTVINFTPGQDLCLLFFCLFVVFISLLLGINI
jgi:hypothetical protein